MIIIFLNFLQIPPTELETIILSHPDVRDAAVVGIPDAETGQSPRAYIVLNSNKTTTASEIDKFLSGQTSKRLR